VQLVRIEVPAVQVLLVLAGVLTQWLLLASVLLVATLVLS